MALEGHVNGRSVLQMARNWSQEGIELGRRLAAELEQEGIRLPMELSAMLNDPGADGVRVVELEEKAARLQQDDAMAAEAEQALAEARAWLALHSALRGGRHDWGHEAWLVSEAVSGALMRPFTGEDGGELADLCAGAWCGPQSMEPETIGRYAAATLAEGRRQLAARPDDAALSRAVRLEEDFTLAYGRIA
jgi:hypothetical protein|nr:MAG TPA: hypothetical protein [Caudoviricetes sp.]